MEMHPLLFEPVYQPYLWGGDRIITTYDRVAPPGVYAESWEISDRAEGMSVVRNGACTGRTLSELIEQQGADLLGPSSSTGRFPLLVKVLDACDTLSVQVHPDDASAAQQGGEAKTEMWYVLAADAGACVYAGFKPDVNEAVFRQALLDQTVPDLLQVLPVQAGDAVFMPGGRVHAIGAGCMMLEVQQNSNTTYRLYDWDRVGTDGQPRDLHIEEAVRVIRWHDSESALISPRLLGRIEKNEIWEIVRCPYFRMERLHVNERWPSAHDGQSFQILFCTEGSVQLAWTNDRLEMTPGTTCLIPACVTSYTLTPVPSEGPSQIVRIT